MKTCADTDTVRPAAQRSLLHRMGVEKAMEDAGFKTITKDNLRERFSCDLIAQRYWNAVRARVSRLRRLFVFQKSFVCDLCYEKLKDYDYDVIPNRCYAKIESAKKTGLLYFYIAYPCIDFSDSGYNERCSVLSICDVDVEFNALFRTPGVSTPQQKPNSIIVGSMVDYYYPYGTMWEIDSFVSRVPSETKI